MWREAAILLGLVALATAKVSYDGYRTLSVGPVENKAQLSLVHQIVDDDERLRQVIAIEDLVTSEFPITLLVHPDKYNYVSGYLDKHGIDFEIVDEDLQKRFDRNMALNDLAKALYHRRRAKGDPSLTNAPDYYMRFDEMMSWLDNAARSSSIASTFYVGRSYQGRNIYGLSINDDKPNLPAVWLDAGIHAREWIAHATAIYMTDSILTGTDSDSVFLRSNFRFYIVPSVNPDGYEHCFTNDRLWRKTRRPYSGGCYGADPNRNFDYFWGRYGASSSPCSDTYRGPSAFSEIETRNVRDAILARNSYMPILYSLHSYTQLWLLPWGGDYSKPSDYNQLKQVADRAAEAAYYVNYRSFRVGTPPDILYAASGGTFDWAKGVAGIKYAYTPELRPASAWEGGFDIPPSNIYPSGREIFAGFAQTCRDVLSIMEDENK